MLQCVQTTVGPGHATGATLGQTAAMRPVWVDVQDPVPVTALPARTSTTMAAVSPGVLRKPTL